MITKIKIGYQTYVLEPHSDMDVSGDIDVDKGIIRYEEKEVTENPQRHFNTLLHECLHAIFDQMGGLGLEPDSEEVAVTGIANGITMILADNPQIKVSISNAVSSRWGV